IYRAVQVPLDRPVVVKTVHPAMGASSEFQVRFMREAKLLSQLAHPNVVTVFDFGVTPSGIMFMVMELLVGHTLGDAVRPGVGVPLARAMELMEGIASGVGTAHAHHMVHRDLKPANIF